MTVQEAIKWLKAISVTLEMNDFHKSSLLERKEALHMGIQSMREVEQYRALGTVEELKEAREKQVAKKWVECPYADLIMCPSCNAEFSTIDNCTEQFEYCPKCGKRLG